MLPVVEPPLPGQVQAQQVCVLVLGGIRHQVRLWPQQQAFPCDPRVRLSLRRQASIAAPFPCWPSQPSITWAPPQDLLPEALWPLELPESPPHSRHPLPSDSWLFIRSLRPTAAASSSDLSRGSLPSGVDLGESLNLWRSNVISKQVSLVPS